MFYSKTVERLQCQYPGKLVENLSLSVGSAAHAEYPVLAVEKLVTLADRDMYTDKDAYYLLTGHARR